METITVFKDSYDSDQEQLMRYSHELFHLRGTVIGLSQCVDSNPEFVAERLKKLAEEFEKGVDISAA
jgi:thiamine kinase-like enzyme